MQQHYFGHKWNMIITHTRATTITLPTEASLLQATGCHWGLFVLSVVELETVKRVAGLLKTERINFQ